MHTDKFSYIVLNIKIKNWLNLLIEKLLVSGECWVVGFFVVDENLVEGSVVGISWLKF